MRVIVHRRRTCVHYVRLCYDISDVCEVSNGGGDARPHDCSPEVWETRSCF